MSWLVIIDGHVKATWDSYGNAEKDALDRVDAARRANNSPCREVVVAEANRTWRWNIDEVFTSTRNLGKGASVTATG